jgi:hypothetical protein
MSALWLLCAQVGNHLAYVLDVLRPVATSDVSASKLMDDEERAAKLMMQMAER